MPSSREIAKSIAIEFFGMVNERPIREILENQIIEALDQARNSAIEECAKVAEDMTIQYTPGYGTPQEQFARNIRNLRK